jgi:hypothetical protein
MVFMRIFETFIFAVIASETLLNVFLTPMGTIAGKADRFPSRYLDGILPELMRYF